MMRDPYRNVKDEEYRPLTYSIGSTVRPAKHLVLTGKATGTVVTKASEKIVDSVTKIGKSWQAMVDSMPKPSDIRVANV